MTETESLHVFQCWSVYVSYLCISVKHGLVVSITLYLCFVCVFVFTSRSRTWGVHYNRSPSSPSSLCSREWPLKVPEPKRPSPPPGQTPLLTSAWTSWGQECSLPSLASPASTPSNKVRGVIDLASTITTRLCLFFENTLSNWLFGSLILLCHFQVTRPTCSPKEFLP